MKEQSTEAGRGVKADVGRPGGLRPARACRTCCSGCWRKRSTAILGRTRYERREASRRRRRLSQWLREAAAPEPEQSATITLRRPRVRGLSERFESRLLPLFKRRTEEVGAAARRELYLHGLAQGDFDLALRGLLGDGAPLSAASIARLKAGWQAEYELWKTRSLEDLERCLPLGRRRLREGRPGEGQGGDPRRPGGAARRPQKVILAVESGHRESTESWARSCAISSGAGLHRAAACGRRRPPRDLGRAGRGLPGGHGAAVLEPSPAEHPRQAAASGRPRRGVCSRRSRTRRRARRPSGRSGRSRPGATKRVTPRSAAR